MNGQAAYVIGVDFGTDSVRTILVDADNGAELAAAVFYYPRWQQQLYCHAAGHQFRQHPLDYIEGMEATIKECLAGVSPGVVSHIRGLSVDTTGSTPVATNREGVPLALLPGFEQNPHAMFILWKDHSGAGEAAQINAHAEKFPENYLKYVGGIYSSEWFWAKLLHTLRQDAAVCQAAYSFVEHCDWIPFLLTGGKDVHQMKRGVCAAGHKILWARDWGGLPPEEFFASLDPLLKGFTKRLFTETYTSDQPAGIISPDWARRLGLPATVVIGVGAYDAHMGAVGGQIEPYYLSKVMGTSTCDMMVVPPAELAGKCISGICGQVPGSVIPGLVGLEAGQSAFGDAYAWFKNLLSWPLENILSKSPLVAEPLRRELIAETENSLIRALSLEAEKREPQINSELALDWFNGRRTPDANALLTAALTGLSLASDAPALFRAIVEATCFGAKAIVERFVQQGIPVKGLIGLGGVAKKSPFTMQMMADIMDMPIRIHRSEQTCALGAAMFAATAAGIYPRVEAAMAAMGPGFDAQYLPNPERVPVYRQRYERYRQTGAFTESQSRQKYSPAPLISPAI